MIGREQTTLSLVPTDYAQSVGKEVSTDAYLYALALLSS